MPEETRAGTVDMLQQSITGLQFVKAEVYREAHNHPERNDNSEEYANRELAHAAHMYLLAGKRKARGEGVDSYLLGAEFYPQKWGGRQRGEELLKKLTAKEMLVRAAALLIREIARLDKLGG